VARAEAAVAAHRDLSAPLAAACAATFFWGLGPIMVAAMSAPSAVIVFWRLWLAVPIGFAITAIAGHRVTLAVLRRAAWGGFLFAASLITGWAAIQQTSVANATLMGALQPVLVLLVAARLFGEVVTRRDVVLTLAAIAGVAVFVLGADGTGGASLRGDLWAVANLVIWTVYFLEVKRQRTEGINTLAYLTAVLTIAAVTITPYVLVTGGDLRAVGGWEWLGVLFIVMVPGFGGHGLMTWAQGFVDVTVLSLITLGSPIVSAVLAWWLLDQPLNGWQLLGGAVVMGAVGTVVWSRRSVPVPVPVE